MVHGHTMTTPWARWVVWCIAALVMLAAAAPQAHAYTADFHEWSLQCNTDGYVLTSQTPISRVTGMGAGRQQVQGIEQLYLGRSCDAQHTVFGAGKWCWANGGFVAEFGDDRVGFARQELICRGGEDVAFKQNCRCGQTNEG